ncbi:cytoskeleton-associated protein 4-like [Trichosurus vulpecula]|uniref:cytoskeleton-associated protein 4-like n=1 Tax=Trichosurus vulpecula TaxID=9337 RepID=UPI00186B32FF|nr:cytoskeleton-associated protein 4-like [Trichosurus vulpecula]
MSSAKQRGSKGGPGSSAPSKKGAHPAGGPDDVAKRQQQQPQSQQQPRQQQQQQPRQSPQPAKQGGGGGGGGKSSTAFSSSSFFGKLAKVFYFLFYLTLIAGASFSGWCVHNLLEEVHQIRLRNEGFTRQREELGQGLQGVMHKVQSLQSTFVSFESILKNSQHKQELTEKAIKQGENEINRISEVLQKLQNKILKDLSDGIHVVKDAREKDFNSLEHTVEERLTELTKSINENIAIFTDVQKRSQKEINEVKAKISSLEETDWYKDDLKALRDVVDGLQSSVKSREKDIESLKTSLETMESDVYTEVKELVNLKQEQEKFREAADNEHLTLQSLTEKILQAEASLSHLPNEIKRLEEDVRQVKANSIQQDENDIFKNTDALDSLQRRSDDFNSRLEDLEGSLQAIQTASSQQMQTLESLLSKNSEHEHQLATLQEHLEGITASHGLRDEDKDGLKSTMRSLGESQLSLYNDVEELKRSVSELPSAVDSLEKVQKQVRTLLENAQGDTSLPPNYLEKLASVDDLKSSLSQLESDLKMVRTAVDSLVAYSVKIETNENNLESTKNLLDDLRSDLDRLFVKVEQIHEKV